MNPSPTAVSAAWSTPEGRAEGPPSVTRRTSRIALEVRDGDQGEEAVRDPDAVRVTDQPRTEALLAAPELPRSAEGAPLPYEEGFGKAMLTLLEPVDVRAVLRNYLERGDLHLADALVSPLEQYLVPRRPGGPRGRSSRLAAVARPRVDALERRSPQGARHSKRAPGRTAHPAARHADGARTRRSPRRAAPNAPPRARSAAPASASASSRARCGRWSSSTWSASAKRWRRPPWSKCAGLSSIWPSGWLWSGTDSPTAFPHSCCGSRPDPYPTGPRT